MMSEPVMVDNGIRKYRVLLSVPTYMYVDARSLSHAKARVTEQLNSITRTVNLPAPILGIEWVGDNSVLPEFVGGKFKGSRKA